MLADHAAPTSDNVQVVSAFSIRERPEFASTIGPLINELPLNVSVTPGDTLSSLIDKSKAAVTGALSRQLVPFGNVVNELG